MRTIWYMGAKTRITDAIAAAVERADPRAETVLDLMSGTSVVSRSLAPRYRTVSNDVQAYAATIAEAYLVHGANRERVLKSLNPERDLGAAYRENQAALFKLLAPAVAVEDAYLRAYGLEPGAHDPDGAAGAALDADLWPQGRARVPRDAKDRARAYRTFALEQTPAFLEEGGCSVAGVFKGAKTLVSPRTIAARRADPQAFPYLLCSSFYPNVYLGLRQAIAVDSLRYAIDQLRGRYARAKRVHYLAALLHAASVTTSATSHFCQPRGLVRDPEVKAVLIRRSFSIPARMAAFSQEIAQAVRGAELRTDNHVTQGDWREVYARWDEVRADVVYADPPYTADNYSRFYHVLEEITRYDYPRLQLHRGRTTKGRYPTRERRHQSAFCRARDVEDEMRALFAATAERGAALVFSYGEENGLLLKTYREAGDSPKRALRRMADLARDVYREVDVSKRKLLHSGQGDSNKQVTELLLVARRPR